MAHVFYPNQSLQSTNHTFSAIWKLTRGLKKAGWIYIASSDGVTKDTTGTPSNDKWGGNADPSTDTYPTGLDSVSAWWGARGPTVYKVPVNTASTGTFLKGEKITQASSGAEGEILGFMYDPVTPANSYLTILTRTGTFDGVGVITTPVSGSGASITPSAPPIAYICEVFFWKAANTVDGTVYYNRVNTSVDTSLGSLTTSVGATATVAPGGGGTGNAFPTTAQAIRGTGGSSSHGLWLHSATIGNPKYQISVTDVVGTSTYSPDGTFWIVCGAPSVSATASTGFGFFRLDNTEDGDIDPFLWDYQGSVIGTRTANTGTVLADVWSNPAVRYGNTVFYFNGWRRRSFASGDSWQNYSMASLYYPANGANVLLDTFGTVETVASTTLVPSPKVREPVWAATRGTTTKQRKGTLRWAFFVPTGVSYDTWDNKTLFQVHTATSSFMGYLLGPWDGTTTPTQT